ncbi:Translation initiation factor IF-2 [BD1-7 clade bacterium]|uniref:Translation initiation factor IF-2 n=1 Tax=BD1-7 clade bacterium TaxID=2029982 RepID=A0A5S9MWJ6_9GAMM|nr:Translation initiation factor IF-2 [BD1-7 clade bacterium]CAA0084356.1 Translation initiation factor IF-2 [BD1-7 clade bacterium]
MAEVTVSQLADTVGTTTDRLLTQMKEAGLTHTSADEFVSEDDKKTLLGHLKTSHGSVEEQGEKKITLKRKKLTTLKTGSGPGKKTVNVEVRKKRTIVKPSKEEAALAAASEAKKASDSVSVDGEVVVADESVTEEAAPILSEAELKEKALQEQQQAEQDAKVAAEEKARLEAEQKEAAEQAAREAAANAAREAAERVAREVAERAQKEAEARIRAELAALKEERTSLEAKAKADPSDPEVMRQLAAAKRREKERTDAEERAARQKAKEEEKRRAAEEEKRLKEEAIAAAAAAKKAESAKTETKEESDSESSGKKMPARKRTKELATPVVDDRKPKRGGGKEQRTRGKGRNHNLRSQLTADGELQEGSGRGGRRKLKKLNVNQQKFEMPTERAILEIEVGDAISVGDLAKQMKVKSGELIKQLMRMGVMATVNQPLDQDTAVLIVEELGHKVKFVSETELEDRLIDDIGREEGTLQTRAPVVTVMGHVDHGKTSLLDYIRETRVAGGEAGGITQHIGAYHVETDRGMVTFLDTPGHAAFTAMRARGAQSTDVVILVVAADDGVMPQTEEAVQHARAAGVPIVVAVNKIDKEDADLDRVKNELAAKDVIPEDWGGDVQFIPVSAHTGQGIDELLDAVLLQSEMLELSAAADIPARGVVIESRLDKGRGVVSTVLIQQGTLNKGDIVLAGESFGRVRAMIDEVGHGIEVAGPSIPVEILGLNATPNAGDEFFAVESEKKAREVAEFRNRRTRETRLSRQQAAKLENMFNSMGSEEKQVLNVVLKTDVRGSLEALQNALLDLGNDEVKVSVISSGVGGITETDANLALTSNAVVFGFNVRADSAAKSLMENEGVDFRYYSVIYDLIDDVTKALSGMLSPELREEIVGVAEVRDVFKSPKFGLIAGSMVIEGTIYRSKPIRVLRDDVVIYEGELESLRRFKDDIGEVRNGLECGIGVKNYQDVRPGDKIEVFDVKEFARTL